MYLGDQHLLSMGEVFVSPFVPENVQPASIDLRLGNTFKVPKTMNQDIEPWCVDLHDIAQEYVTWVCSSFVILSGQFVLATTEETIYVPPQYMAQVDGRSSIARLGLFVHVTAGFIDPGFRGKITLELYNSSPNPLKIHAGDRICQISYADVTSVARPYGSEGLGSHYQNQDTVTESRFDG